MSFVTLGGAGGDRPSFFELVAAERLMPSLKAAVIYSLSVYALRRCGQMYSMAGTRRCAIQRRHCRRCLWRLAAANKLCILSSFPFRPGLNRLLDHEDELFFLISVLLDRQALQASADGRQQE